jgi:hypothetical protein
MSISKLDSIMTEVRGLSPDEQLQLIKRVADILAQAGPQGSPRYLIYGEFKDAPGREATEEDFKLAEWHPTEKDLNGP